MKSLSVTIQIEATEQYFSSLIILQKVVLSFKFRDEILEQYFRGTQRENFSKILEISFSAFLDCFRAFKRHIPVS